MMKYKGMFIGIVSYLCIAYFINVMTLVENANLSESLTILFLNFRQFAELSLDKFDPRLIIMFLIFIYILCIRMLSVVHENASFKSMLLNKYTKKQMLHHILIENVKHVIFTYLTVFGCVLLLYVVVSHQFISQDLATLLRLSIYLFRVLFIIFSLHAQYTITSLISVKLNVIPMLLIGFGLIVMFDFVFGCSLITFSNSLNHEVIYMIIEIVFMSIIYLRIKYTFMKKEDLFND